MAEPRQIVEIAKSIQREVDRIGCGPASPVTMPAGTAVGPLDRFDMLVTSVALRDASRGLFADGYYARAVEEAYKCVNSTVKAKARIRDSRDGQDLMNRVFSEKDPALRINDLDTDSRVNEQAGYMLIFAGVMRGIRNPRAHEHLLRDEPDQALELLVLANHLMRVTEQAKRPRKAHAKARPATT